MDAWFSVQNHCKLQARKILQPTLQNAVWMDGEPTKFTPVLDQNSWKKIIVYEGLENYTRNIGLDSSRRLDSSRSTPLDSPEEPRLGGAGRSRRDSSEADPDAIHQRGRR